MINEYKEQEDTEEMPVMPEVTEEISACSELEVEAYENPSPSQEDTRLLSEQEQEENDKKSKRYREKNSNLKPKYQGRHIYVWFKQNPLVGGWDLHHTYPESLEQANIKEDEVKYGGKEFKQFSYFRYDYKSMDKETECNLHDSVLLRKYSLTPDAKEEEDNWKLCRAKMIREGIYNEELGGEIEKRRKERQERKRKQESNQLTELTPIPRFSQKQ